MTHRNDTLYSDFAAVTTSDTADNTFSGLYIGVTGNVAITGASGNAVTFKGVPAGTVLPVVCNRVMATNTTATDIVGLIA